MKALEKSLGVTYVRFLYVNRKLLEIFVGKLQ